MRGRYAPRRRETRRSSVGGLRPPAPMTQTAVVRRRPPAPMRQTAVVRLRLPAPMTQTTVGRRSPATHDDLEVLVAASGQADERDRVAAERRGDVAEVGDRVRPLARRGDPRGPR